MKPAQPQSVTPGTGPTAWDNYPRTLLSPLPPKTSQQVVPGITEQDSLQQATSTEAEGRWDILLQKLDSADAPAAPRQLTDTRRFEYRFEIHGAPGQDERAIADEVEGMTKSSPAFNGNNSMLDGGQIW